MHPLFKNVKLDLSPYLKRRFYKPKEVIFNEGALCSDIGIILSGEVYISTITHHEKTEIIQALQTDDLFGDLLVFTSTPYYLGTCITHKKAEIVFIEKNDFLIICNKDSAFLLNYLQIIANKSFILKQENKLLRHKNNSDRILHYLYEAAKKQNTTTIYLTNITTFANRLSLPRPSVSRELSLLQKKGFIKKDKTKITLLK